MTGSLLGSVSHSWLMNCEMVISAHLDKIYHFTYVELLSLVFCFRLPADSFMGVSYSFTNIILSQVVFKHFYTRYLS